jgi:RNA polymerase sigma-70 factor (ECF subfamily)
MSDIETLIAQARQGDDDAITQLYQLYAQPIFRYISYRVTAQADAEDLTTEVFIRMVEGLPNYQITGAPFEAWLYRIAAARIADFHRKTSRRPQSDLTEWIEAENLPVEEQIHRREQLASLREALERLTEEQQMVLLLRFIERKSHADVARILGKSETAVKSIQHRALSQLTALLGTEAKPRHYLRGEHD